MTVIMLLQHNRIIHSENTHDHLQTLASMSHVDHVSARSRVLCQANGENDMIILPQLSFD